MSKPPARRNTMSDLDPITVLRDYYQKHGNFSNVVYDEDQHVILDGTRLSLTAPTAFKRQLNTHEFYFYTVHDVIFYVDNISLSIDQYRQKVIQLKTAKVKAVIQQDKSDLMKYIDGNPHSFTHPIISLRFLTHALT